MVDPTTPTSFDFSDQPPAVVATQRANLLIYYVFAWLPTRIFWEFAIAAAVVVAMTPPIRAGMSWWGEAIVIIVFIAVYFTLGYLQILFVRSGVGEDLLNGMYRFPQFELYRARAFRFHGRCIKTLVIDADADAERLLRTLGRTEIPLVEAMFREKFLKIGADLSTWGKVWQGIRAVPMAENLTYSEAMESGRLSIFYGRALVTGRLIATLIALFGGAVIALLPGVIHSGDPLQIVRLALVAGISIAAIIFVNFTISLRKITFLDPDTELFEEVDKTAWSKETKKTFEAAQQRHRESEGYAFLKEHAGRSFYPKLDMKPGYVEGVRNYFVWQIVLASLVLIVAWLGLLAVVWATSIPLSGWSTSAVNDWAIRMSLGVLSIPILLTLSLVFGFLVIARLRRFVAILLTGVLVAVVPPLIAYATGSSQSSGLWIVSGVATAVASTLPLTIAELLKREPSVQSAPA